MNGAVCEIIEWFHHGGRQSFHHIILHQNRSEFEADGQDRRLVPQLRAEVLHGRGPVCGTGIGA